MLVARLGLVTLLLAGCAASRPAPSARPGVVVESSENMEIAPLNARVEHAAAARESWVNSPLRMTVELFGGDVETRSVRIEAEKNLGEGADTTTVTLIRDGFMDDSVRGSWQRIVYHRLSDGTWRVVEAKRATRCWRGERLQSYGAAPCP